MKTRLCFLFYLTVCFCKYTLITGSLVPKNDIHANLQAIMQASNTREEHPLPVLTAEHRETWAALRSRLESDPKNAELLHKIDGALFGVFLDDKSCDNEYDATEMFLHGEGHSR